MGLPVIDNFPEKLRLRDTELYDDQGGLGQRIFTTAGAGYVKQEYVRADLYDNSQAQLDAVNPWLIHAYGCSAPASVCICGLQQALEQE